MDILRFPVGEMQANCYFLIQDKECLIVDPGDSADFILEEVQRRNLKVVGLLATHGHFDHVMAVGEIQVSLGIVNALPLHMHKNDEFLIRRLKETAKHFLRYDPAIILPQQFEFVTERSMSIGSFQFEVIYTPGHTPGSCCFYFTEEQSLFTGDVLFKEGVGRYDFSYSNKTDLFQSLQKLFELDEVVSIYPGHGEDSLLQIEKENIDEYFKLPQNF